MTNLNISENATNILARVADMLLNFLVWWTKTVSNIGIAEEQPFDFVMALFSSQCIGLISFDNKNIGIDQYICIVVLKECLWYFPEHTKHF